MRRSPRRPLILKRRKLPFQLNDPPAGGVPSKEPHGRPPPPPPIPTSPPDGPFTKTIAFPDGIHVVAHPTRPDTQVVVIPQTADLQCVIGALTAKGKEHGPNGPNKFILLTGSSGGLENDSRSVPRSERDDPPPPQRRTGGPPGDVKEEVCLDIKPLTGLNPFNKDLDCSPLDDSLTNMQWLGTMSTDTEKSEGEKENYNLSQQESQASVEVEVEGGGEMKAALSDRPPYSYMAMIQFAINSRPGRRMTLKEIYTWIVDHFPFFQQQTKPGWKNSIRHNLSLHDMFTRETSPDGKVSYWTIRPEANRCLTLDQVYKAGCEGTVTLVPVPRPLVPHQEQTGMLASSGRGARGCVRRMKPLLPRSESYLVPFQLPAAAAAAAAATTSIFLPSPYSPQVQLRPAPQRTRVTPRANKRVRIAPKVVDAPAVLLHPVAKELKEEPLCVPLTPRRDPRRGGGGGGGSSRRKQRLVLAAHEEPVLLFQDSSFFDSGVASDASGLQDTQPGGSPPASRELSFKTPVKGGGGGGGGSHLASSTPSKPPGWEPWKVTPLGKGTQQAMLDFSPIRTPSGPLHTPRRTPQQQQQQQQQHLHQHQQDYSGFSFSFSGTSFTELPLFSSPRELLTSCVGRDSSPPAAAAAAAGHSLEGLMLDTMNDSLSKVLVDISFSGLEDEDLGTANISWSEFIPQMM